ncbi:hypothetical protein E4U23_006239 [Claviceps purpurea]|nr:hypothetical protein E4U23_006239 [Claviceps purpurea]
MLLALAREEVKAGQSKQRGRSIRELWFLSRLPLSRKELKTGTSVPRRHPLLARKEQLGYRWYTFSYVSYDPEFLISAFPVRIEQPNVRPDRSDMVIGVTGSNFNVHTHNPIRGRAHIRSRISVRMSV